jgi:hypothetical protein
MASERCGDDIGVTPGAASPLFALRAFMPIAKRTLQPSCVGDVTIA